MGLRDRLSGLRDRLGGGDETRVQRARKRARRTKLKRRAREAASKVPSKLSNREALEKARAAADRVEAPDDVEGSGFGENSRDVARRAEHAATVADPIGASLNPAEPDAVEDWATPDDVAEPDESAPSAPQWDVDPLGGAPDDDAGDPLAVEDDFLSGGDAEDGDDGDPLSFQDDFFGGGRDE